MTHHDKRTRRDALKCLGFGSAGTLFALAGGVLTPIDLAASAICFMAADHRFDRCAVAMLFGGFGFYLFRAL